MLAVGLELKEMDVANSSKAAQLRSQLTGLDNALTANSSKERPQPIALKVQEGDDRVYGYSA